jgi:hypothetical protein
VPTLASPLAFEFCEGGTCGDAKPTDGDKHVICPPSDKCKTGGCYCQLFKRKKGAGVDDPWEPAHVDNKGNTKYRPTALDYKCFCVKPILEHEVTIDDQKYTLRYQLCGTGACTMEYVTTQDEIKCKGACEGDCKCTMFRLKIADKPTFDPSKEKWERVAKADKQIKPEGNFIYRCFCVK